MIVQLNTDNHIEGRQELATYVSDLMNEQLGRFGERITRVEVHLADENADKKGDNDKRCTVEARLDGLPSIAVTHFAGTIHQAIDGATTKLVKTIDSKLGRLEDRNAPASRGTIES